MMVRVLILSDTRPSRVRRIAEWISRDNPDFAICGVVQHALRQLPVVQQVIAKGGIDRASTRGALLNAVLWLRQIPGALVHWLLWFVHGCPRGMCSKLSFTVKDLAALCRQSGWQFLLAAHLTGEDVVEFARRQCPNLVIVLGEPLLGKELFDVPSVGLARVVVEDSSDGATTSLQEGAQIKVEYFARGSERACPLVALHVPSHNHDGSLGNTLKSDLIADDLLVQASKWLGKGSRSQASKKVGEWAHENLAPYLDQFGKPSIQTTSFPRRHRSILKLCVESLLCLPWVIGRNWYRRMRNRYPVLILAHHLASDRPHRMGMSTGDLWRRIRFLQRQYRIVSLSEAGKQLGSGTVSMPTAVLTFDDGYCDNYIALRAVAEETGAKIVVFLATRQVELRQEFDHDLIAGTRGFFPLTWDQIEDWSRRDIEFGSHTRTHFDCGSSDCTTLAWEIVGSGRDVEVHLGRPCRFFAFPFGKRENMSPEATQIAASNYSIFLSSYGGENLPHKGHTPQHLLRKGFYYDPWELELEMQSVFDLLQSSRLRLQRWVSPFRLGREAANSIRRWLWTLLHACLLLLALLPPFRRLLNAGDL